MDDQTSTKRVVKHLEKLKKSGILVRQYNLNGYAADILEAVKAQSKRSASDVLAYVIDQCSGFAVEAPGEGDGEFDLRKDLPSQKVTFHIKDDDAQSIAFVAGQMGVSIAELLSRLIWTELRRSSYGDRLRSPLPPKEEKPKRSSSAAVKAWRDKTRQEGSRKYTTFTFSALALQRLTEIRRLKNLTLPGTVAAACQYVGRMTEESARRHFAEGDRTLTHRAGMCLHMDDYLALVEGAKRFKGSRMAILESAIGALYYDLQKSR